ncbi:MAG: hypothetical protein OXC98_10395 [bacterium]|nr:hypothetical protein [bacterium]
MSNHDPRLIDLINRSGPAHHQAFLEVDGWGPEWPIWYAEYFWEPIQESFAPGGLQERTHQLAGEGVQGVGGR